METDHMLEGLMSQIGEFSPYQVRQYILHLLAPFLAGIHMLSLTVVAPTPTHRCYINEVDNNFNGTSPSFNVSWLQKFIPLNKDGELQSCVKFVNESRTATESCDGRYVYDDTYYHTSRVIDWDLVCDKRWQRAMIQSVYIFGVLMGAIVLGSMADIYGRKPIFYISGIVQLLAGFASAFIPNFILYTANLFVYGMFGSGGAYVTGFVLTMELVGPSKRTLCGTLFSAAFGVGIMAVAGWASVISDHKILQSIFALHSLLLVGHWWLIDESVRWLWGQGRLKDAIKIVEKAVKSNGKKFVDRFDGKIVPPASSSSNVETYGTSALFKTPRLRCRVLIVAFCWFANSLVFYGLSLNSGNLLGNPFLMLCFIGLAEVPACVVVVLLVDRTGRRSLCAALMMMGGCACIAVAFVTKGNIMATILMIFGKFAIAGSFAIAYNYTAELFPTVVRNSAVGIGAMSARFSGMLTPLITLLDSLSMQLPAFIFGGVAIASALLTLFLPETLNKEMPQTLEDGENFGRGDTGYKTCFRLFRRRRRNFKVSRAAHT